MLKIAKVSNNFQNPFYKGFPSLGDNSYKQKIFSMWLSEVHTVYLALSTATPTLVQTYSKKPLECRNGFIFLITVPLS